VALHPNKADAPLIIDSNAVLPFPLALQRFQPVSGQCRKGSDIRSGV
jgi:hypothetical protein